MRLSPRLKKQWVSLKKELRGQFPNFHFSRRFTLGLLFLTAFYLYHLSNTFLNPQNEVILAPLIFATEDMAPMISPTPAQKVETQSVFVPVLTYHYIQDAKGQSTLTQSLSVSPQKLEEQFRFLTAYGYESIDPDLLYRAMQGNAKLPPKPVLLTFDDGYQDFYTSAYPLLKKYALKATSFVSVGLLDTFQYMNKDEVRTLAADPKITFGGHTIYHPDLTVSVSQSAWDEINHGKKLLEQLIGKEVISFAYPYGHFNQQVTDQVRQAGFKLAFTTQGGWIHSVEIKMSLPRITVHENSLPFSFQKPE